MSQDILNDMNKKVTVNQLKQALEISYRNGGGSAANLLFGAEAETVETLKETLGWLQENEKYNVVNTVPIGAYPGSAYYNHSVQRGLIKDQKEFIAEGCPTINMSHLSDEKFSLLTRYIFRIQRKVKNKGKVVSLTERETGYDAVLQCRHCGFNNMFKGIRKVTVKEGILRTMGCRKCRNYSDYVFDERKYSNFPNLEKWYYDKIVDMPNQKLADYMQDHQIKRVMLYGLAWANPFVTAINEAGIEIVCGIDRVYDRYLNRFPFPVYGPQEELPEADIILVIAVDYFRDIYDAIQARTDIPIISVEEVLE